MENEEELFELTKEQKRAFNRLKKAHADCLKSGIYFYNNYGLIGACDYAKINRYDDIKDDDSIHNNETQNSDNEFYLDCGEWADDAHYFHPTNKG